MAAALVGVVAAGVVAAYGWGGAWVNAGAGFPALRQSLEACGSPALLQCPLPLQHVTPTLLRECRLRLLGRLAVGSGAWGGSGVGG